MLSGDHKPEPILAVPGSNQMDPRLSPDGRWIAYSSEGEAGQNTLQVFVQPFPPTGTKYQISRDGGDMPAWSRDGKRLFYRTPIARGLASVSIVTHPSFSFGGTVALPVDGLFSASGYDIVSDGRFVVPVQNGAEARQSLRPIQRINVILNLFPSYTRRSAIIGLTRVARRAGT